MTVAQKKESVLGHIVRISNDEPFVAAIEILNELPGTWHSRGDENTADLFLLESPCQALLEAGVISHNNSSNRRRRAG